MLVLKVDKEGLSLQTTLETVTITYTNAPLKQLPRADYMA